MVNRRKIGFLIYRYFWFIALTVALVYLISLARTNMDLFNKVLPEFIAGTLGAIIGFGLYFSNEFSQKLSQAKEILKSIKEELNQNLEVGKEIQEKIRKRQDSFLFFKIDTWKMFGNRLDVIANFELIKNLGLSYYKFDGVNQIFKKIRTSEMVGIGREVHT